MAIPCTNMNEFETLVSTLKKILPAMFKRYGATDIEDETIHNVVRCSELLKNSTARFVELIKLFRDMGRLTVHDLLPNKRKVKAIK